MNWRGPMPMSGETKLAEAIRYALGRLPKAPVFPSYGRLELDNHICTRNIRPMTMGRKNYLPMGSLRGGNPRVIGALQSRPKIRCMIEHSAAFTVCRARGKV